MRKLLTISVCVIVLAFALEAKATVLTFDDLPALGNGTYAQIVSPYGGLDWSSSWYYMNTTDRDDGYANGTVSGDYVAFNGGADDVSINNGVVFDWDGAYFTSAWDEGLNIDIKGYSGAALLYSTTLVVGPKGPALFAANWAGIDNLTFSSYYLYSKCCGKGSSKGCCGDTEKPSQFVMDNFSFNNKPSENVPEPTTFLLIGSGLVGLGFMRRKFKG
ncbi:hypothetical protein MNBD_NITROSPIRAE03-1246 [hydrothermal vent metagenome]|uniref:Ice-binding protein C-terminal domain-containing protein n=1 Tax=hydrothermal vent metagenome TaxID=652676 RepID=A0A3B1D840_9ZZZZ